jgi:hypothetical protein
VPRRGAAVCSFGQITARSSPRAGHPHGENQTWRPRGARPRAAAGARAREARPRGRAERAAPFRSRRRRGGAARAAAAASGGRHRGGAASCCGNVRARVRSSPCACMGPSSRLFAGSCARRARICACIACSCWRVACWCRSRPLSASRACSTRTTSSSACVRLSRRLQPPPPHLRLPPPRRLRCLRRCPRRWCKARSRGCSARRPRMPAHRLRCGLRRSALRLCACACLWTRRSARSQTRCCRCCCAPPAMRTARRSTAWLTCASVT